MMNRNFGNFNGGSSLWGDQKGNWKSRVSSLVAANCTTKINDPERATSNRTRVEANENVMCLFGWLRKELGFKGLSNPLSLDERHFVALAECIKEKKERGDIGAAMAAGYATSTRKLARWIGKPNLVGVFGETLGKEVCRRQLIAQKDKSWQAAGVDIDKKIIEVMKYERWVGLALWTQNHFGLRKTEVLMFKPLRDIQPVQVQTVVPTGDGLRNCVKVEMTTLHWNEWIGGVNVFVTSGTKGARPRVIHITNDHAIEAAYLLRREILAFGDREHLPPPWFTLKQNARTYERVMLKFGITQKALGITAHGLRAGFACDLLESYGVTPTVRGGNGQHTDPVQQTVAYKQTTEAMGHGRISVIGAYAGSISPRSAAKREKNEQQWIERQLAIQELHALQAEPPTS